MNNALKVTTNDNATPLTNAIDRGNEMQSELIRSLSDSQKALIVKMYQNRKDVREFRYSETIGMGGLSPDLEAECDLAESILDLTDVGDILSNNGI